MLVSPYILVTLLMVFVLLLYSTFLFYKGNHIYSNVILGLYLVSQIIGLLNGSLFSLRDNLLPKYVHLFLIGYPIIFIWLPLYFLFVCSLVDTRFRIKSYDWLHFLPSLVVLAILVSQFYFKSSNEKLELLDINSEFMEIIRFDFLFSLQIVLYNVAAIIKYYGYRKRVKNLTNNRPEYDFWISRNFYISGGMFSNSYR